MTVRVFADLTPEQVANKVVHKVISFITAKQKQQKDEKELDFAAMVRCLQSCALVAIIILIISYYKNWFCFCYILIDCNTVSRSNI